MEFLLVPKEEIDQAFAVAVPQLLRACKNGQEWDLPELREDLILGRNQLWMGVEKEELLLVMISEIQLVEDKKVVFIYHVAGSRPNAWLVELWLLFYQWCLVQRISRIEIPEPRAGWKKYLLPLGFKKTELGYMKEVHHAR